MSACPACGEENPERAKFCLNCASPLGQSPVAAGEVRKTVTVLFADMVSSTSRGERLDPEATRRLMGRYFEAMRRAVERHGGTVEKFIGDAVMAVFGIPILHEDDALRGVRAAIDIRAALADLNAQLAVEGRPPIAARMGINTGEVVAGDPARSASLVTGDAVNVAARLEQAAAAAEILLGADTYRLVRDFVSVEPVAPLVVRGKAEPLAAFRLVDLLAEPSTPARRLDTPLVGRDRELTLLRQAFDRAVRQRGCHLFTLLGSAGIGKSRLVHEFTGSVRAAASVLRGRCLPYGDGITYWPIAEVVQAAAGIEPADGLAEAMAKLGSLLAGLGEDGPIVTERVASAIGLSPGGAPAEEIFWATRKLLETIAAGQPLVLVLDDLHWAEPTLLDFIEHVADWSREAPILLLCVARPELLDIRPQWSGGKLNATTILLEPLAGEEAGELIANLLGSAGLSQALQRRITEAAEGNPLFVEELVSMLIDDGILALRDGSYQPTRDLATIAVPPTVSALLAARLDRLVPSEREVIGRAAVVGKVFQRAAVAELTAPDGRSALAGRLMALVRKELVRPERSSFAGDEAFRFRHMLVRDAAYGSLPKEQRADLHARFAAWLERVAGERLPEHEEIIGYHLEQAHGYRSELGATDGETRELGRRAADMLTRAGRRAFQRDDIPAAVNLQERAAALLDPGERLRRELLVEVGSGLREMGELARADAAYAEAIALAGREDDEVVAGRAAIERAVLRGFTDPTASTGDLLALADRYEPIFRRAGDERGLIEVLMARCDVDLMLCQWDAQRLVLLEAIEHIRHVGDQRLAHYAQIRLMNACLYGSLPTSAAITQIEALAEAGDFSLRRPPFLAPLLAMRGEFNAARAATAEARARFRELGLMTRLAALALAAVTVAELAGDRAAAERDAREGIGILEAMHETGVLSTLAAMLANLLVDQGRLEEADEAIALAQRTSAAQDIASQAGWRNAQARLLADRGDLPAARSRAEEAIALAAPTDYLELRAEAFMAAAHVERRAGRAPGERAYLERALAEYERKENLVAAARVRDLLAALPPAAAAGTPAA